MNDDAKTIHGRIHGKMIDSFDEEVHAASRISAACANRELPAFIVLCGLVMSGIANREQ
ncbi:MAG TPA: hypothetical protein VKW08_28705 [Xanthobacteraceae bacterium]|jgi:hypothetical protein|nr:hypothetical protein [Xanthobacteraceae bacterium]